MNVLEADVCIVGCGPAGITLATELISAGCTVVIIEAGGAVATADHDLLRGQASGPILKDFRDYLAHSRRCGVGGSGAGWGRVGRPWLTPLTSWDLEPRPWVVEGGWPLPFTELAPYYRRAAAHVGLPGLLPEQAFPSDRRNSSDDAALRALAYQFPPDAGILTAHFRALLEHESFQVVLGTVATTFDVAGATVERLRAVAPAGAELAVTARDFVLAAGGVENARLLLLNAPARAGTLPTVSAVTGRYFVEHPHVVVGLAQVPLSDATTALLPSPSATPPAPSLWVAGLTADIQRSAHLLNATVQFAPAVAWTGPPDEGRSVTCDMFLRAEQQPNPSSYVALGDAVDALGRPRPVLRWTPTTRDWTSIVQTAETVAELLDDEPGWSARVTVDRRAPWPAPPADTAASTRPTWGNHHMGTTRMATSPEAGAVDVDCRVFGTTNLYVAGSSVFPTGGSANPTFTIIALAIRLADHLTQREQCR